MQDLKNAGFTAGALQAAGFSPADINAAPGLLPLELHLMTSRKQAVMLRL